MSDEQGTTAIAENAPPASLNLDSDVSYAPAAAPTTTEGSQPPPTAPPSKYGGKSAEELARMLEDQERHIGRQAQELGELRQTKQTYEQWLSQMQMAQAQQAAQPQHPVAPVEEDSGKFDWENPDKAVDRRVERRLKSEMDAFRRQVVMETAASQAPIAKNIAKTMYPDAFKGVSDDELDRAMYGGAAAGNVTPQNLTKPEAWRMLGWILQGEKTGYKMQSGVNPVSPTTTESPVAARSQTYGEEPIVLDDQARKIIRDFGADEASVVKSMREERRGR